MVCNNSGKGQHPRPELDSDEYLQYRVPPRKTKSLRLNSQRKRQPIQNYRSCQSLKYHVTHQYQKMTEAHSYPKIPSTEDGRKEQSISTQAYQKTTEYSKESPLSMKEEECCKYLSDPYTKENMDKAVDKEKKEKSFDNVLDNKEVEEQRAAEKKRDGMNTGKDTARSRRRGSFEEGHSKKLRLICDKGAVKDCEKNKENYGKSDKSETRKKPEAVLDNKILEERERTLGSEEDETRLKQIRCAVEHEEEEKAEKEDVCESPDLEERTLSSLELESTALSYGPWCVACTPVYCPASKHINEQKSLGATTPGYDSVDPLMQEYILDKIQQIEDLSEKEKRCQDEEKDEDMLMDESADDTYIEECQGEVILNWNNKLLSNDDACVHREESFKDIVALKKNFQSRRDSGMDIHGEIKTMRQCLNKAYDQEAECYGTSLLQPANLSEKRKTSLVLVTSFTSCSGTQSPLYALPSLNVIITSIWRPEPNSRLKVTEKEEWMHNTPEDVLLPRPRPRRPNRSDCKCIKHGKRRRLRRREKFAKCLTNRPGFYGPNKPEKSNKGRQYNFLGVGNSGRRCSHRGSASRGSFQKGKENEEEQDDEEEDEDDDKDKGQEKDSDNSGHRDTGKQPEKRKSTGASVPPADYKRYRKKHCITSDLEWAEFLGQLATQCTTEEGPHFTIPLDRLQLCLEISMEILDEVTDDMLDCTICTSLHSMLKHFADCPSSYNVCLMCIQIFSLVCSHAYACARNEDGSYQSGNQSVDVFSSDNVKCQIKLCQKICHFIDGDGFNTRVRPLWIWLKKNLSRVIGEDLCVDPVEIEQSERKSYRKSLSSIFAPSLTSIPESGPSSGGESKNNSRTLRRKWSNLQDVSEQQPEQELPGGDARGETTPSHHSEELSDTSVHSSAPIPRYIQELFSLPDLAPYVKPGSSQYHSFVEGIVGEPGIGEVVYGNRQMLVKVAKFWKTLQEKYQSEGGIPKHYREEGVILLENKKNLCIIGNRYQIEFQWVKVSHLGNGMTGKCHLATDFETDFNFCVKEIHISNYESQEIELWSDLVHPNIVKFYGAIRVGEKIYLLSEFIGGGCLTEAINTQKALNRRLSHHTALTYFKQILEVLVYMKGKNILHEDLKADNILLSLGSLRIKVVDFGLARRLNVGKVPRGTKPFGTQTQWSPEKAESVGYGHPAEVWAAVCVLIHMLSGYPPWVRRFESFNILHVVIVDKSPPLQDIPRNILEPVQNLMEQGFIVNPDRRPTAEQLLQHRAFSILNDMSNNSSIMYSVLPSGPPLQSYMGQTNKLDSQKLMPEVNLDSLRPGSYLSKEKSKVQKQLIPDDIFQLAGPINQPPVLAYPAQPDAGESKQNQSASSINQNSDRNQSQIQIATQDRDTVASQRDSNTGRSVRAGIPNQTSSQVSIPQQGAHRSRSDTQSGDAYQHFLQFYGDTQKISKPLSPPEVYEPSPQTVPAVVSEPDIQDVEAAAQSNMLPCFNMLMSMPGDPCDSDEDVEEEEEDIFKDFNLDEAVKKLNLGGAIENPLRQGPDSLLGASENASNVIEQTDGTAVNKLLKSVSQQDDTEELLSSDLFGDGGGHDSSTLPDTSAPSNPSDSTLTASDEITSSGADNSNMKETKGGNQAQIIENPGPVLHDASEKASGGAGFKKSDASSVQNVPQNPSQHALGTQAQRSMDLGNFEQFRLPQPRRSPDDERRKPLQNYNNTTHDVGLVNYERKINKDEENKRLQQYRRNPVERQPLSVSPFLPKFDDIEEWSVETMPTPQSLTPTPQSLSSSQNRESNINNSGSRDQGAPHQQHKHLHLDLETRKKYIEPGAQSAPVKKPASKPVWVPELKRSETVPGETHATLLAVLQSPPQDFPRHGSSPKLNSVTSVSTPRSMHEQQREALRELTDPDRMSHTSDSTFHLNDMFDDQYDDENSGIAFTVEESEDLSPESLAQYISKEDENNLILTVILRRTNEKFRMSITGESRIKTWVEFLEADLTFIHQRFQIDRFVMRNSDNMTLNLEDVIGDQCLETYVDEANDSDDWWMEAGMVHR